MKKKLLLVFLMITSVVFSQINYAPTWPDASWVINGAYAPANLLDNPTLVSGGSSDFKFDDTQISNTGDIINLESPVIDLSAAAPGEKGLLIQFNVAYTISASELLAVQYWDADNGQWYQFPGGSSADPATVGNYQNCTYDPTYSSVKQVFDFSNFTNNQKQNFKIRFVYQDGNQSSGTGGLCLSAPTFTSLSCNAPTALYVDSKSDISVAVGWTANNGETQWNLEYGNTGFTIGSGNNQDAYSNPWGINGFAQQTTYDIYVRADCSDGDGTLMSDWSSKLTFTTNATCNLPTNGVAGGITATTADLSWFKGGSETEWDVQYGLQNFTPGNGEEVGGFHSTDNTSNGINSLLSNTSYDFYVSAHCGVSNDSGWAGPFNFTTANPLIDWCNLQWPDSGTIEKNSSYVVYSQVYETGVTGVGQGSGISVFIGYNNTNTDPSTWTNWVQANFNKNVGNNDEYMADIGLGIGTVGTYYYASRVQLDDGNYKYGGYNAGGGGFWDGITYVSGVLTVTNTMGLEDQKIAGFNLAPNPVKDKIDLSYKTPILNVEIYNLIGQKVFSSKPNSEVVNLSLSALKAGIYILKIRVRDKQGSYKIIKD